MGSRLGTAIPGLVLSVIWAGIYLGRKMPTPRQIVLSSLFMSMAFGVLFFWLFAYPSDFDLILVAGLVTSCPVLFVLSYWYGLRTKHRFKEEEEALSENPGERDK